MLTPIIMISQQIYTHTILCIVGFLGFFGVIQGRLRKSQNHGVGAWGPTLEPQMGFGILKLDPIWGFAEDYTERSHKRQLSLVCGENRVSSYEKRLWWSETTNQE